MGYGPRGEAAGGGDDDGKAHALCVADTVAVLARVLEERQELCAKTAAQQRREAARGPLGEAAGVALPLTHELALVASVQEALLARLAALVPPASAPSADPSAS